MSGQLDLPLATVAVVRVTQGRVHRTVSGVGGDQSLKLECQQ